MARYRHIESGVTVVVDDDREMDSSWEPVTAEKAAPAKRATARKSTKSDES